MQLKRLGVMVFGCLGFAMAAHANEVLLTVNQPMKIIFRVAHQNQNSPAVLGELQSVDINKTMNVPVSLNHYDKVGIIIVSADGHALPSSVNQFDQPKQCSMTTDKAKATGTLEFTLSQHAISCHTHGGVFG